MLGRGDACARAQAGCGVGQERRHSRDVQEPHLGLPHGDQARTARVPATRGHACGPRRGGRRDRVEAHERTAFGNVFAWAVTYLNAATAYLHRRMHGRTACLLLLLILIPCTGALRAPVMLDPVTAAVYSSVLVQKIARQQPHSCECRLWPTLTRSTLRPRRFCFCIEVTCRSMPQKAIAALQQNLPGLSEDELAVYTDITADVTEKLLDTQDALMRAFRLSEEQQGTVASLGLLLIIIWLCMRARQSAA
eukprot:3937987-Rhodomonas_salina.2